MCFLRVSPTASSPLRDGVRCPQKAPPTTYLMWPFLFSYSLDQLLSSLIDYLHPLCAFVFSYILHLLVTFKTLYVWMFFLHVCLCGRLDIQRPEEHVKSLGNGSFRWLWAVCECWELNQGPLQAASILIHQAIFPAPVYFYLCAEHRSQRTHCRNCFLGIQLRSSASRMLGLKFCVTTSIGCQVSWPCSRAVFPLDISPILLLYSRLPSIQFSQTSACTHCLKYHHV